MCMKVFTSAENLIQTLSSTGQTTQFMREREYSFCKEVRKDKFIISISFKK